MTMAPPLVAASPLQREKGGERERERERESIGSAVELEQ